MEQIPTSSLVTNAATLEVEPEVFAGVYNAVKQDAEKGVGILRYEIMGGTNYAVVPMVMLAEGVHIGSNGPLFYPAEELSKTPAAWDHKPVVVYHPTMNGQAISACKPEVISRRKVGLIMNTKWEPGKAGKPGRLKAEAYLELNRLGEVDKRVLEAVKTGTMMEVSTGLFTDNENKEGMWKTESYKAIAKNYRADHLAILPDEKGAFSIKDGGGLMRNSRLSHAEIRNKLSDAIIHRNSVIPGKPDTYRWLNDVYDSFCIYTEGNKCYHHAYELDGKTGDIKLNGSPSEVTRTTQYRKTDGTVLNTKGKSAMAIQTPEEFVDTLIANGDWSENEKPSLLKLPITSLVGLVANASIVRKDGQDRIASGSDTGQNGGNSVGPSKPGKTAGKADNAAPCDDDEDDETTGKKKKPAMNTATPPAQTLDELLNNASPALRGAIQSAVAVHNSTKDALIGQITANKLNTFTKEQLVEMELPHLQAIAALAAAPAQAPQKRDPLYGLGGGLGTGPAPTANKGAAKPIPLAIPKMTFGPKK